MPCQIWNSSHVCENADSCTWMHACCTWDGSHWNCDSCTNATKHEAAGTCESRGCANATTAKDCRYDCEWKAEAPTPHCTDGPPNSWHSGSMMWRETAENLMAGHW